MLLLKAVLVACLGVIAYQDAKDRTVSWPLFPLAAGLLFATYIPYTTLLAYALSSLINLGLMSGVIGILWFYTHYIAGKGFLNVSFGLGDLLFFYAFALGFPTQTFLMLFAGSLLFALLAWLALSFGKPIQTIPLAGMMSAFLGTVLLLSFLKEPNFLYLY